MFAFLFGAAVMLAAVSYYEFKTEKNVSGLARKVMGWF